MKLLSDSVDKHRKRFKHRRFLWRQCSSQEYSRLPSLLQNINVYQIFPRITSHAKCNIKSRWNTPHQKWFNRQRKIAPRFGEETMEMTFALPVPFTTNRTVALLIAAAWEGWWCRFPTCPSGHRRRNSSKGILYVSPNSTRAGTNHRNRHSRNLVSYCAPYPTRWRR